MSDKTTPTQALAERLRAGDSSVVAELVRRDARDALLDGLDSEYDLVREEAVSGLGRIGDLRDLPTIVDLLDDIVIQDVAQLAAQDYGAAAVDPLVAKLRSDDAVLCAIEGLGVIGDGRAVGPLTDIAETGDNETVRQWAREALDRIAARGG